MARGPGAGCGLRLRDYPVRHHRGGSAPRRRKPANPADARLRTMVNAVPGHKPTTLPVQVKFDLRDRPQVAQPLDIELVIVPLSAGGRQRLRVHRGR